MGGALASARRAAELVEADSALRPVVSAALGECLYYSGELDEAESWLAEASELAPVRGYWRVAAGSLAHRSFVAGDEGRVDEQMTYAKRAAAVAREHGLEEMEGDVHVAVGAALQAMGRTEEALGHLEHGVALLRLAGHPRNLAHGLIRYAAALRVNGRHDAVAVAFSEARATIDSCADPGILGERLAALERPKRAERQANGGTLSTRELVVLRMLSGSLSERDIGRELYLSHSTIHSHTKSIYRKLGVSSRPDALNHARELGLI